MPEGDKRMRVRKKNVQELGLLLLFKALLEVAYVLFLSPNYEYAGFILDPNSIKFLESYIFLIFLYIFLPSGERKISAIGTKLLFVIIVVPMLSWYALADQPRAYLYASVMGFWITLLIIQIFPRIRIKKPVGLTTPLLVGLGILSIGVYVILIKINGLPTLKALDFTKVYEIRHIVKWSPAVMGYLVPWQANIINPFLLSIAWYKRRYVALLGIIGLQLFLYLITAHKSFLFAPLLVGFVIYAIHRRKLLKLTLLGLIAGISGSLAVYAMGWSIIPASLFIRRALFVPAQLSFYYYDFFSKHQLMYLAESHLNPFLSTLYDIPIPKLIGQIYFHSECWANTCYLADAYMNFGFLGIFLFSAILGIVFIILDSIVAKTDITIAVGATIVPILSLTNGALFTTLGTSGLLLGMIIVWLYSQRESYRAMLTTRLHSTPIVSKGIE